MTKMARKRKPQEFPEFDLTDVVYKYGNIDLREGKVTNLENDIAHGILDGLKHREDEPEGSELTAYDIWEMAYSVKNQISDKYIVINREYNKKK